MKIYLDDVRQEPNGWIRCYWADEVVSILKKNMEQVKEISLDHDLGNDERSTGYDVLLWIEEELITKGWKGKFPKIKVHSMNPVGRDRMNKLIKRLEDKCLDLGVDIHV